MYNYFQAWLFSFENLQSFDFSGVYFHVVGEGVVRVTDRRQQTLHDRENYIDFRMRLLGEPGQSYRFTAKHL